MCAKLCLGDTVDVGPKVKHFQERNVCILNMEALVVLEKRTKTKHVQHTHLSLATPPARIFSSLLDLARSMY